MHNNKTLCSCSDLWYNLRYKQTDNFTLLIIFSVHYTLELVTRCTIAHVHILVWKQIHAFCHISMRLCIMYLWLWLHPVAVRRCNKLISMTTCDKEITRTDCIFPAFEIPNYTYWMCYQIWTDHLEGFHLLAIQIGLRFT